jgi:hypothetical protein
MRRVESLEWSVRWLFAACAGQQVVVGTEIQNR